MAKSMIIVGGGIAGLSTGCYARMNGYDTTLYEMHSIPGGLCTAWKRKGYTFDISMHMLTGSKTGAAHTMWQELGVVQNREFHYHDEIMRIENGDKRLDMVTDRRQLQEQMLALSPADSRVIKEFVDLVTGKSMMDAMTLKPAELTRVFDSLKTMRAIVPLLGKLFRYGNQTIQEFAQRVRDPFLRNAIRFFIDSPGWPMLRFPVIALAGFVHSAVREAGVPIGGSQRVVFDIADMYETLGGEIHYNRRVEDIIIENDRAVGVRLADGSEDRADIVVWAADGRSVIYDILGGKYVDDRVRDMYDNWLPVLPLVHVALGVNRDLSEEPHRLIFKLDEPVTIAGEEHEWMCVLHHCFDPTTAPPGKSVVEVWYATRYDDWEDLSRDRSRYEEEKKRIAEITIAELDKRWPGFASQVEVVDVPTPVTYVRYTGNWQGSPDGWYITPENMRKQNPLRSLPGLSGFYMVGQWTLPFSGTVMAALSGRQLVQVLCARNGTPFVTSRPSP
jgi:phytoene dehydrogenase-like protein